MKIVNISRKAFAILLLAVWLVYCVINLVVCGPLLKQRLSESWDFSSSLSYTMEAANGGIAFQEHIQNAGGYLKLGLQQTMSVNYTIIQAENGQFTYLDFYPYLSYDFSTPALQMQQLQQAAQDRDATFLYLNATGLYIEGTGSYGSMPVVNHNPRADAFLNSLNGYGVEALDSRTVLAASALAPQEYRYRTASYWTTQASFEVYLSLVEKLREQGANIDGEGFYTDSNNFTRTEYPSSYVGDIGKRVSVPVSGYDDFTLIEPGFETDFFVEYRYANHSTTRQGSFTQALLETHWINSENPYQRDMYAVYLTGEYPLCIIQNRLNPNGPKILFVGDAYMLPVASFIATAASEIHLLWPYTVPESGTLIDYLEDGSFDCVVVGMSPSLLYADGFNYLRGIEVPQAPDTP